MVVQQLFRERINTPTGYVLIVTDVEQRLRAIDWEDYEHRMHILLARHYGKNGVQLREEKTPTPARRALLAYFDGDLNAVATFPTATNGTPFQCTVWNALRRIPAGHTTSYGLLAAQIGNPNAARAVGLANGSNPIAIAVPCHRVIGANNSLTGFGGGIPRKHWLLKHEGFDTVLKQGNL